MELKVGKRVADYRLVFFQPEPESGERLCIALLFSEENGKRTLLYDNRFARVHCFAPMFEVDLLRFLMRSLDEQLRDQDLKVEQVLLGLGSQLSLSAERRVIAPITQEAKMHLLERFVIRKEFGAVIDFVAAESQKKQFETHLTEHILKFARPLLNGENRRFIENASPMQVLGRKLPGTDRVSLLIDMNDRVAVLDGVDLSLQTPKEVIRRTGKVAHTFWQYRHYAEELVFNKKVERVALIFNGTANPSEKYRDAQGFAREILAKESELILEHDSIEDLNRLEALMIS